MHDFSKSETKQKRTLGQEFEAWYKIFNKSYLLHCLYNRSASSWNQRESLLSLGQTLLTFHYTMLEKCRALLSVVERGWPNALDFSLDLELNIPRIYYLMNNSFMECFVHYLMNSNCTCARSTTLDNFALVQTSLDKNRALDFTQQGGQTLSTFTQHACRALYSEKSRAFGQGFTVVFNLIGGAEHQGCIQVARGGPLFTYLHRGLKIYYRLWHLYSFWWNFGDCAGGALGFRGAPVEKHCSI